MKVRVPRRALADATSWSASHLAPKPTVPARAGILLEATDGDQLTVAGVDWDVTTHNTIDADVHEPGRIVIPGRLAAQVISTYRDDLIDITTDAGRAVLTAGRDRFMLTMLPEAEYPAIAERPTPDGTVDGAHFSEAVRQAAVATDPTVAAEPWRGGIQLTAEDDRLTVWATDRYRMAERSVPWTPTSDGDRAGALVPARSLADAVKGMNADGKLHLTLTGKTAGLADDTRYTTLVRIDEHGRKDPHQYLPDEFVTEAIIPVDQLVAAVKRACLVATDRKPKILVGFGSDEISVRAAGEDTGAVAMDVVDGQHLNGPAMQVAFGPTNLLDGLQVIATSEVRIGLTSNVKPALLHAVGDESDYRYLVMPVRLA
ncbi:DNA polymerase III subunit beta [Streptomyces lydicamycinicus]|uniref:DNA polymerase III subunit beta n=1 Tax=Streptomyces lydicamycinicus TaxID=1546107 RepID=UPI003C2F0E34